MTSGLALINQPFVLGKAFKDAITKYALPPCHFGYDRLVVAGYSWGGDGAIQFAKNLKNNETGGLFNRKPDPISVDLLFTLDPVSKLLPNNMIEVKKDEVLVDKWLNYYQRSDTRSLLGGGVRGSLIPAANNAPKDQLVTTEELKGMNNQGPRWGDDGKYIQEDNKVAIFPGDPTLGHSEITYLKRVQQAWINALRPLVNKPFRAGYW